MQAVSKRKGSRLGAGLLFLMLMQLGLLLSSVAGYGQTLGPDAHGGLSWASLAYYAGGGTNSTPYPFPDGTLRTDLSSVPVTALAADSLGNLYFAGADAVVYMVYENTSTVPPLLAAVTTKASPALVPQQNGIYQIAGASGPSANCLTEANPQAFCADNASNALLATFGAITSLVVDPAGSIYTIDGQSVAAVRRISATVSGNTVTTSVTTVAGTLNCPTASGYPNCPSNGQADGLGDGGPAIAATLNFATGIQLDSLGNLYIADSSNAVIRVVYLATASAPPAILPSATQNDIYVIAGQPGQYCFAPGPCATTGPATSLMIYPATLDVDSAGNIYYGDLLADQVSILYAGGAEPALLTTLLGQATPIAGDIYPVAGMQFSGTNAVTPCPNTSCGDGGPALSAQIAPSHLHVDGTGNVYIDDYSDQTVRKVDTSGYISASAGTESGGTPAPSSGVGGPVVNATFAAVTDFVIDPTDNLYIADTNEIWQAPPVLPQIISFPALPAVTYGTAPVALDAVAENSGGSPTGLPITYSVTSGPGSISGSNLIVTGAGTIQITATQAGSAAYSAASASQSLTVNKALLTVIANNASRFYDTANPAFTASYTGFVNGDSVTSAVAGQPAFSTTASLDSSVGTYPITVTAGSLTSANYTFTFVPGTLFITGTTPQQITFAPLTPITYGQETSLTLTASATPSGLPITYTLGAGSPATVAGSVLKITGAGTIVVTANQYGNNTYTPATPVTQSLVVSQAPLTITGPTFTLPYGTAINVAGFPAATITGFVNGDTQAEVTGSVSYTTTASGTPHAGTSFPVQVAMGTLALLPTIANDYVFINIVPGTLTIVPAAQTIVFNPLVSLSYGGQEQLYAISKDANSNNTGLPVTLTATNGDVNFGNQPSALVNPSGPISLSTTAVGSFSVIATQAGSGDYAPAQPVTQSASVQPALLYVTANNLSREFGAANPTLTYYLGCPGQTSYTVGCFADNDTDIPSVITGAPVLSSNTDTSTAAGSYPIVVSAGTLVAPNYTIVPINGTLTILPAGSYTIASNVPSVTIPAGQSRQLSLTVTPINLYQGSITMSCGTLPANVSCIFSPATYNFNGSTNVGGSANPVVGTLTINTLGGQPVVGAIVNPPTTMLPAAFLLPGCLAALLVAFSRHKAFAGRRGLHQAAVLLLLGVGALGMGACGSSGTATNSVAVAGTLNLTITGTGTTASGTGNVVQTLNLNVVIQ